MNKEEYRVKMQTLWFVIACSALVLASVQSCIMVATLRVIAAAIRKVKP